jgi:hypothetical protein
MLAHNPPPLGNGASSPMIPLPVALYVSDELILSSMTGDGPAADFRSFGRGWFRRRKASHR